MVEEESNSIDEYADVEDGLSWLDSLSGSIGYYDVEGNRITMRQYLELFVNRAYRFMWQTTLPNGWHVSTVWLGLDHNFWGGPPLIFETMTFHENHTEEQWRYSTLEEARIGHENVVKTYAVCELIDFKSED